MDRETIMKQWDKYSGMLRDGHKSSLPRDWFENLLDVLEEDAGVITPKQLANHIRKTGERVVLAAKTPEHDCICNNSTGPKCGDEVAFIGAPKATEGEIENFHPIDKPLPECPTCKRVWMDAPKPILKAGWEWEEHYKNGGREPWMDMEDELDRRKP